MSIFPNENPNNQFDGIEMFRGGLLEGFEPIWARTNSGALALIKTHQTSTSPVSSLAPAVTFFAECKIPEGSIDPTMYPGHVEFWMKSGVRVNFDMNDQSIIIECFGIFTSGDLDSENINLIKSRFLSESTKRDGGRTYVQSKLPMKVILERAFALAIG